MLVDSPIALFTTLFGWQFYNAIWFTLLGSGIALLPFLGLLIDVLFTERDDGEFLGSNPDGLYKRLEARLLMMLAVVAIAAQPSGFTRLTTDSVRHQPLTTALQPAPTELTAANAQNSFGDTGFGQFDAFEGNSVDVPIWWFSVLSVSSGINQAVLAGFPTIQSLRDFQRVAKLGNITDPILRAEVTDFYNDCYLHARKIYLSEAPEGAESSDISWMGSRFFLEEFRPRGGQRVVYETIRSEKSVNGFPFNANRDTEWRAGFEPEFGKPTCSEWWLGTTAQGRLGLRDQLLEEANPFDAGQLSLADRLIGLSQELVEFAGINVDFGQDEVQDQLIQAVLQREPLEISNSAFGEGILEPNSNGALQVAGRVATEASRPVTVGVAAAFFSLFMDIMTIAMPMVQPMILMTIYALLPFAIVASRYSLSILAVGAIGIFTVNFWPVLWHMATWVDDNLTLALFPPEEEAGKRFLEYITDPEYFLFGNALDPKLTVLNMVTASLFLILPGIFTAVMAWAGIRAVGSLGQLTSTLNSRGATSAASGPSQSLGMVRGKIGGKE